jgi:hypothetical protein
MLSMTQFMRCARMRLVMELDSRDFSRGILSRISAIIIPAALPLQILPTSVGPFPFREPMSHKADRLLFYIKL